MAVARLTKLGAEGRVRKSMGLLSPAPMEISARASSTITTTAHVGNELPPPLPLVLPALGLAPPVLLGLLGLLLPLPVPLLLTGWPLLLSVA